MQQPWPRLLLAGVVLAVLAVLSGAVGRALLAPPPPPPAVAAAEAPAPAPAPPPTPPAVLVHHEIGRGDTLGGILSGYGVDANAVRDAALEHHDLAKVRLGRHLIIGWPEGGDDPTEVRYRLGEDDVLVVSRSAADGGEDPGGGWSARVDTAQYTAEPQRLEFTVESTLWGAATEAGLRAADILTLAKIFESDVDFNTEIRAGARVELVVDELTRSDGFTRLDTPVAVRFTNGDKVLTGTRFDAEGPDDDDDPHFYDDEGFDRRGAFLRSPLEFSRVTSGFSTGRFHPVLKRKRPHYGTDFGAPTGTPVRAVARGRVVRAEWNGGHGRFVKIDHDGPYETSYSHLSKILVKRGEVVSQGQVIGKVGSSGMSTGPHLHYQLWVNGRYQDAMSADLPRSRQLSAADRARFGPWRDKLRAILDGELPASALRPSAGPTPAEGAVPATVEGPGVDLPAADPATGGGAGEAAAAGG